MQFDKSVSSREAAAEQFSGRVAMLPFADNSFQGPSENCHAESEGEHPDSVEARNLAKNAEIEV